MGLAFIGIVAVLFVGLGARRVQAVQSQTVKAGAGDGQASVTTAPREIASPAKPGGWAPFLDAPGVRNVGFFGGDGHALLAGTIPHVVPYMPQDATIVDPRETSAGIVAGKATLYATRPGAVRAKDVHSVDPKMIAKMLGGGVIR